MTDYELVFNELTGYLLGRSAMNRNTAKLHQDEAVRKEAALRAQIYEDVLRTAIHLSETHKK